MTTEMAMLMNASLIPAVDSLLVSRMGGFWYVIMFTMPAVMVYFKTQNIAWGGIVLLWSMMFYGYMISITGLPFLGTIVTVALALTLLILFFKAWSPAG